MNSLLDQCAHCGDAKDMELKEGVLLWHCGVRNSLSSTHGIDYMVWISQLIWVTDDSCPCVTLAFPWLSKILEGSWILNRGPGWRNSHVRGSLLVYQGLFVFYSDMCFWAIFLLLALVEMTTHKCAHTHTQHKTLLFHFNKEGMCPSQGRPASENDKLFCAGSCLPPWKRLCQGPSGQLCMLGEAAKGSRWMGSWESSLKTPVPTT